MEASLAAVREKLDQASVPYSIPESANFNELLSNYTGNHLDGKPGIITVPESHSHVETIVVACAAANVQVVARGGGHDLFGRSTIAGAVTVDLRKLNSVTATENGKNARIGGGATHHQVLQGLVPHGLQVPVGSCGGVGYVGWCVVGGLGPYIHSYGLGADQIVGAKVVNAQGKLVEADEDMLKGLRGGGVGVGVVVELTVKAYPLQEIQAGLIMFESSNLKEAVTTFFTNYAKEFEGEETVPAQLYVMPFVFAVPGLGMTVCCGVIWNGVATDESRSWIDRVAGLAPLMPGMPEPRVTIATTKAVDFCAHLTSMLPTQTNGRTQSATISHFSPEAITSLAKLVAAIPSTSNGGINVHTMRSNCPSCSDKFPGSISPYREPHVIFELLGVGPDDESAKEAAEWAMTARNEMMALDVAEKRTYIGVTSPECLDLEAVFGDRLGELKQLKRQLDPNGVFKDTLAGLV